MTVKLKSDVYLAGVRKTSGTLLSLDKSVEGTLIADGAAVNWPAASLDGWLYRKKITVDHTKVPADLTNFPVKVVLRDADVLAATQPGGADLRFTDADGTSRLSHETVPQNIQAGTGCWSWFSRPTALFLAQANKTIWSYVSSSGTVSVAELNHNTGAITLTALSSAALEVDDHNAAAFVRRADGKLVAFYSKHSADTTLRYRVSTNPDDATAWETEQTLTQPGNTTYANPFVLSDGKCYLITRCDLGGSTLSPHIRSTSDYSSWSSAQELIRNSAQRPYVRWCQTGDRIDFLVSSGNPGDAGLNECSIFHFYAKLIAGTLNYYRSNGTQITSALPLALSDLTKIYDGSTYFGWNWDIAIDADGYPRVLFTRFVSTTDHRYMFARLTASGWTKPVEIAAAGTYLYAAQPYYSGGICFDASDPNIVYLSKESSGVWEMQRFVTADSGATWTKSADITASSGASQKSCRPISPLGHKGVLPLLFWTGTYTAFNSFASYPAFYPLVTYECFVRLPALSSTVDTSFYLWYGNASAADQSDAAAVWDSNYKAVYHLSSAAGKVTVPDSTANACTGTKTAVNFPGPTDDATGGPGQLFNRATACPISLGTPSALNFAGLSGLTVEALFIYDGTGNANDEHHLFSNWDATPTEAAVMLRVEPDAGGNVLEIFAMQQTDTQVGGTCGLAVTKNVLSYAALRFNSALATSSVLQGFVDGTKGGTGYGTNAVNMDATASTEAILGGQLTGGAVTEQLGGKLFEMRISATPRSDAWIATSAANLKSPSTFYAVGAEESVAFPKAS